MSNILGASWASHRSLVTLAIVSIAAVTMAIRTEAAGECCSHCGCHSNLFKFCRLVCDTKQVTETHYGVKCEDICLPGRSHKCGCEWIPSCGRVKTVKKLMKIETTTPVPTYKCVVETVCRNCCDRQAAIESRHAAVRVAAEAAENGRRR